jgi:hypothetical protein
VPRPATLPHSTATDATLSRSLIRRCAHDMQAWAEGVSTIRLMTGKRAETLLEVMGQIEYFTLGRAWAGLTDDEFFWEPFTTTWSIRRPDECRTSNPFGAGEWVADFEIPEPAPVPMTTIAWLYWHIGSMPGRLCDIDILAGRAPWPAAGRPPT